MAKANYSGRKSAVVIGLPAEVTTGSYPEEVVEVAGKVNVVAGPVADPEDNPELAVGEYAFYRNGTWIKVNKDAGNIFVGKQTDADGNEYDEISFLVPSANSIDLTNGTEIESWESFGTIYRDKMPTIMDWNGSIAAKVDFGDNPAQVYIYKSLLQQKEVTLYSYLYFVSSNGAIDTSRAVRQYGQAYITSFNISASPTTVADVTIDYEGNGELKMQIGSEVIKTDWAALNE